MNKELNDAALLRQIDAAVRATRGKPLPLGVDDPKLSRDLGAWASRWGIVTSAKAAKVAAKIGVDGFATYCCQREPYEVRELLGRLVLWLFLFDDAVGEAPTTRDPSEHAKALASYLEVARLGKLPDLASPFHHSLQDIRRRAVDLGASPDWVARFPEALGRFFAGCQDEAAINRSGRTPALEEYRELRPRSVGMYTVFAVLELGRGGQLSATEARSEDIVWAQTQTARLCAWINDLYSYPKEVEEGRCVNLLMTLLSSGQTFRQALSEAVKLYDEDLSRFEAHCSRVTARWDSSAVTGHLEALAAMVHGNRAWTRHCGRYSAILAPEALADSA